MKFKNYMIASIIGATIFNFSSLFAMERDLFEELKNDKNVRTISFNDLDPQMQKFLKFVVDQSKINFIEEEKKEFPPEIWTEKFLQSFDDQNFEPKAGFYELPLEMQYRICGLGALHYVGINKFEIAKKILEPFIDSEGTWTEKGRNLNDAQRKHLMQLWKAQTASSLDISPTTGQIKIKPQK